MSKKLRNKNLNLYPVRSFVVLIFQSFLFSFENESLRDIGLAANLNFRPEGPPHKQKILARARAFFASHFHQVYSFTALLCS